MTDGLRVLDLFSGIGGFSLGLERTGERVRQVQNKALRRLRYAMIQEGWA